MLSFPISLTNSIYQYISILFSLTHSPRNINPCLPEASSLTENQQGKNFPYSNTVKTNGINHASHSLFLTKFLQGEQEDCTYSKQLSLTNASSRKRQFQHNCFRCLPQKNTDFFVICLLTESLINNIGRTTKSVKIHTLAISVGVFNVI